MGKITIEDLRTFNVPNYAFTEAAVDKSIDIITDRKQLPPDYASRYLTGGTFGQETAQVNIYHDNDGVFNVRNSVAKLVR